MEDQETLHFLALHHIAGIGPQLIKQLISYCGSAEAVFKKPKGKLEKIPGIGPAIAHNLLTSPALQYAEKEIIGIRKSGTELLFFTDRKYPSRLKAIADSPTLLYFKGNVDLNHSKTVGIVGTRKATDYGKAMTEKIIRELIPHNPLIISGLAYGIDIQAHKQSLTQGLTTIGVMGSGMDVIYPSVHKETAKRMETQGGLLTEYRLGTRPDSHNFPARNRIIAALSDVLIIVEAAQKGGALITADISNSYNKDVFAVPGSIEQPYSEGCNLLIKTNRAHLFTSVKDVEYIMNWNPDNNIDRKSTSKNYGLLTPDENLVITALQSTQKPLMIDELTIRSGLSPGLLAAILLELEFKNLIRSLPGKAYEIK